MHTLPTAHVKDNGVTWWSDSQDTKRVLEGSGRLELRNVAGRVSCLLTNTVFSTLQDGSIRLARPDFLDWSPWALRQFMYGMSISRVLAPYCLVRFKARPIYCPIPGVDMPLLAIDITGQRSALEIVSAINKELPFSSAR